MHCSLLTCPFRKSAVQFEEQFFATLRSACLVRSVRPSVPQERTRNAVLALSFHSDRTSLTTIQKHLHATVHMHFWAYLAKYLSEKKDVLKKSCNEK
jgi:O-glycosyl hydrolase